MYERFIKYLTPIERNTTPWYKNGYALALGGALSVGGIMAAAGGGGGGGGSDKKCSGYTQVACTTGQHISATCPEDPSFHKCTDNVNNTPENCSKLIQNEDKCEICKKEWWQDENGNCIKRVNTDNCAEFDEYEDICSSCTVGKPIQGSCSSVESKCFGYSKADCNVGFHIDTICPADSSYHLCSENNINTTTNCETIIKNEDKCALCKPGYKLVEGNCIPIQTYCKNQGFNYKANCPVYYNSTGTCDATENDGTLYHSCEPNTINTSENCQIAELNKDQCITCTRDYFNNEGNCTLRTNVEFCEEFNPDSDTCSKCAVGAPVDGVCNTIEAKCAEYNATGDCAQNYYKDYCGYNSAETSYYRCLPGNISKCMIYVDQKNECQTCEPGFFLNANMLKHKILKTAKLTKKT